MLPPVDHELEFKRRFNMTRKTLSTSSFALIALLAAAAPCLAQSIQDQTRPIAVPAGELAVTYNTEKVSAAGLAPNLPDPGREKSVGPVLPVAKPTLAPAAGGSWEQLTGDEKDQFGRGLKAEAIRWSVFGAGDRAEGRRSHGADGKSVVFVHRGSQPYQR
jgi:hypothetical protein